MVFHPLDTDIPLPEKFNNPFYYEPNPLCELAVERVKRLIEANGRWSREVSEGKMFGVLIVRDSDGGLGYLVAYSGQILGRSDWDEFVPAVFDYLQPTGYFKEHEREISDINACIERFENSDAYKNAVSALEETKLKTGKAISEYRKEMAEAKARRDLSRRKGVDTATEATLTRESQYMKAELRRTKQRCATIILERENELKSMENGIANLKRERKKRSDNLQNWLFEHFVMLNARGEKRDLISIFANTAHGVPPAGAGECCAPKLLQYAYSHDLHPVCMAEFWWGKSPNTELRRHLHYYPACRSKCKPILGFMLRGLNVESNILEMPDDRIPKIVFEDDDIIVVNKPSGMLSVPGKSTRQSVYDAVCAMRPDEQCLMMAHRLDMGTSGLLIIAKSKAAHKCLQEQFSAHTVRKRYVALLDSELTNMPGEGVISLPMRADIMDRPRQTVDFEHGKNAVTRYKILEINGGKTRVVLYPSTGRTHQLRVHCAHHDGLGSAIVGDELYGSKANCLYLHAEAIEFTHPTTGERLLFEQPTDF